MTTNSAEDQAERLFAAIEGFVERGLEAVVQRGDNKLAALERRVAELEQRPTMKHVGVWEQERQYSDQQCVTHHGSVWLCRVSQTRGQPGASSDWQLICKRGADGRNAR